MKNSVFVNNQTWNAERCSLPFLLVILPGATAHLVRRLNIATELSETVYSVKETGLILDFIFTLRIRNNAVTAKPLT